MLRLGKVYRVIVTALFSANVETFISLSLWLFTFLFVFKLVSFPELPL